MDKTSKKVTKDKDPKRVDAARKGREKYMNKLKESILNDAKKGAGDTTNASNETSSASITATTPATNTNNTTTIRSNDTYVYGVGMLAALATDVCVFLHITLSPKIKNKTMIAWGSSISKIRINHQNDVICFSKKYKING